VDTLSISFTGRLAKDPAEIPGKNGTGVRLWIEVPLDSSTSRYFKVIAWGTLATHVLNSARQNDRVTVRAGDIRSEDWLHETDEGKQARSCVTVRASDISVSLAHDDVTTGRASRRAAVTAAANGEPTNLPAAERADLQVLAGVTAPAA
jgi:single-stranded DNA-binding protein